jgi:hypothetical protein
MQLRDIIRKRRRLLDRIGRLQRRLAVFDRKLQQIGFEKSKRHQPRH